MGKNKLKSLDVPSNKKDEFEELEWAFNRPFSCTNMIITLIKAVTCLACTFMPVLAALESPNMIVYGFEVSGKRPIHDFTFLMEANMSRFGVLSPEKLTAECFLPSMNCDQVYAVRIRNICDHPNVTSFALENHRRYQCSDITERDPRNQLFPMLGFMAISFVLGLGMTMTLAMFDCVFLNVVLVSHLLFVVQLFYIFFAYWWIIPRWAIPYELAQPDTLCF